MEIKSAIVNEQNNMSTAGVMGSKILRQAQKIEALEWPLHDERDSLRKSRSVELTLQKRREVGSFDHEVR